MTSSPLPLLEHIRHAVQYAGGWLPFDAYMDLALYRPGQGYYARALPRFGDGPQDGSDFITAPELSPLFGQTLARQVAQALRATGTNAVWEFGPGSGALASQILTALDEQGLHVHMHLVELSATLRQRQQARLQPWVGRVHWHDTLPDSLEGVVLGNELLDAMPVQLLARREGRWHERGVALNAHGALCWSDRLTTLRPPMDIPGSHDYVTEIHPRALAFMRTLARVLRRGAAFLIDYGFPQYEYYHPQRHMGTLMCHRGHRSDSELLQDVGDKDITAHVDFSAIALAAQDADLHVLGYTSQAHFLFNCGLTTLLEGADLAQRTRAQRLVVEHEMGELIKVLGVAACEPFLALGFSQGDRTHTL